MVSRISRFCTSDEEDSLELPDHNYSPSLVMNELIDGRFTAHIPMADLPMGELQISKSDNKKGLFGFLKLQFICIVTRKVFLHSL